MLLSSGCADAAELAAQWKELKRQERDLKREETNEKKRKKRAMQTAAKLSVGDLGHVLAMKALAEAKAVAEECKQVAMHSWAAERHRQHALQARWSDLLDMRVMQMLDERQGELISAEAAYLWMDPCDQIPVRRNGFFS